MYVNDNNYPPHLCSSYVSPSRGLKGLPILSQLEAVADTANAVTYCKIGMKKKNK